MKKIQKETGIAYLFIAHDLSMVKYISDKIGVLHLGHLVETGTTEEIFDNPNSSIYKIIIKCNSSSKSTCRESA